MKQFVFEILPFANQLLEKRFHQKVAQRRLLGGWENSYDSTRTLINNCFFIVAKFENRTTVTIDVVKDEEIPTIEALRNRLSLVIHNYENIILGTSLMFLEAQNIGV